MVLKRISHLIIVASPLSCKMLSEIVLVADRGCKAEDHRRVEYWYSISSFNTSIGDGDTHQPNVSWSHPFYESF